MKVTHFSALQTLIIEVSMAASSLYAAGYKRISSATF
jgi:hypothetical protein